MTISDKLTKGNVGTIVSVCTVIFMAFLFLDNRYFHSIAAEKMEVQIAGALNEQMKKQQEFYIDQQKINDMRQIDQLRCSKVLLEAELKRSPTDRLLIEKLSVIDRQIKMLEDRLYK